MGKGKISEKIHNLTVECIRYMADDSEKYSTTEFSDIRNTLRLTAKYLDVDQVHTLIGAFFWYKENEKVDFFLSILLAIIKSGRINSDDEFYLSAIVAALKEWIDLWEKEPSIRCFSPEIQAEFSYFPLDGAQLGETDYVT